jgi:hypothetical protein
MAVNYNLNPETVLRDTYRFLTLVMADREIAYGFSHDDPAVLIRRRYMRDEFLHLLISTAVMNRLHDEHRRSIATQEDQAPLPELGACGKLQPDVLESTVMDLSFREACNKIIHAEDITHEADE